LPVSLVIVSFTMPVPTLRAVTVAPGISAPAASETVPPSVAFVVWPNVSLDEIANNSRHAARIILQTARFFWLVIRSLPIDEAKGMQPLTIPSRSKAEYARTHPD